MSTITVRAHYKELKLEGDLILAYVPFHNKLDKNGLLVDFRTDELAYTSGNPVNMTVQPSYDGSVNVIINDDYNKPKMINSRFSVKEDSKFAIIDHVGNRDTNLYEEGLIEQTTSLYKQSLKIIQVDLDNVEQGGRLKCGTYHFYFKFADNDDNETDFIAESGLVTCFIGNPKNPSSVRMGMVNEDSKKLVKLKLSNVDTSFDFVKVYYTRTTSDASQKDIITAHQIETRFPIFSEVVDITITGFENVIDIPLEQINPKFQYCQVVKTQAQCLNMLFFGNIDKPTIDYEFFTKASYCFCPEIISGAEPIGNIDKNYRDLSGVNLNEYYNPKNIYYKLGYFPTEYYRFGIVYILNDYTLSDVFNVRGVDFDKIPEGFVFSDSKTLEYDDDGLIKNTKCSENVRGVTKIPNVEVISNNGVIPIGVKFKFNKTANTEDIFEKLLTQIKGYFFVRLTRIPTFYAQGLVIGKTTTDFGNIPVIKTSGSYIAESFIKPKNLTILTFDSSSETKTPFEVTSSERILGNNYIPVLTDHVENKALIVPEALVRLELFNALFTSDEFKVEEYETSNIDGLTRNKSNYYLSDVEHINKPKCYTSKLTMVNDGMKLTTDGDNYFSARAGEAETAIKTVDVNLNMNLESDGGPGTVNSKLTKSTSVIRGMFGTYVGMNTDKSEFGTVVNIRPNDYDPDNKLYLKNQYILRANLNEPYYAISQRYEVTPENIEVTCYRGDCYVATFTHRLHRNFIDPELPVCDDIVDYLSWSNNYAVIQRSWSVNNFTSNEICESFYRKWYIENNQVCADIKTFKEVPSTILLVADDITGNETWKQFGAIKINRADVNAVPLGTWVTVKVLSNVNLSLRDIDLTIPGEQAIFNRPRGFYPLFKMSKYSNNKLPESSMINGGANVTLSQRINIQVPDIPWFKNQFDTRIMYSDIAVTDAFKNGFRIFLGQNYRDYPKTYGALVALKEYYGDLIAVMENGVLRIPVNERAVAAAGSGGNVYINTSNVLPENPLVISDTFGSIWQDSVIKTSNYVYGVDTTAKKIWRTDGRQLEIISDFRIQKFLNDKIKLNIGDKYANIETLNVKTHFNAFKHDVIFTFYKQGIEEWSFCYNEVLQCFTTRYSWMPVLSENINNIFFTFDRKNYTEPNYDNSLWKHGQAGNHILRSPIRPTTWYNKVENFEYEFIVNHNTQVQKIFNNLKIIQNKTNPEEFEYEVVGETYDWFKYKRIIVWLNDRVEDGTFASLEDAYIYLLNNKLGDIQKQYPSFDIGELDPDYLFKLIPYLKRVRVNGIDKWEANSTDVTLIHDELLNEDRIWTKQYGNDIKKVGRVKGNMEYLEDLWDIEIRPTNFRYAYLDKYGELKFKILKQERIRDKYVKIRVRYSGKDLAVILALKTFYLNSYA